MAQDRKKNKTKLLPSTRPSFRWKQLATQSCIQIVLTWSDVESRKCPVGPSDLKLTTCRGLSRAAFQGHRWTFGERPQSRSRRISIRVAQKDICDFQTRHQGGNPYEARSGNDYKESQRHRQASRVTKTKLICLKNCIS